MVPGADLEDLGLIPLESESGWEEVFRKNVDDSDGVLLIGPLKGCLSLLFLTIC